ncbi:hypothetical protein CR513_23277, partial [Mucuna pruriens]
MEKIRTHAEKHIETKENQANQLESERQSSIQKPRPGLPGGQKGEPKYPTQPRPRDYPLTFTPCTYTTQDMPHVAIEVLEGGEGPTCEFHKEYGHSIEECWNLQEQIEKLIQEGHLGHYILGRGQKDLVSVRPTRKGNEDELRRDDRDDTRREERRKERSRSEQRVDTRHRGVITTISSGGANMAKGNPRARDVLAVHVKVGTTPSTTITFSERDMRYEPPRQDETMVISVVMAEYKVERVLIDQGNSANILYWLMYKRLGFPLADLELCLGSLYGFIGKHVMIKGIIELETTFGERSHTCTIPILYTMVDVDASYNIIIGRPTLNKLGAVVSTLHVYVSRIWANHWVARRCYEDSLRIGSQSSQEEELTINMLDLDLDPQCKPEHERPFPAEDLKEVNIGPSPTNKTRIGTVLIKEDEGRLIRTRMCSYGLWPTCWGSTRRSYYPTWLANVVMVKKANGKWRMCTDYTDLNKACPKDPYPLPNIDRLVDRGIMFRPFEFHGRIFRDEAKTTFITDSRTFYYKVMSFGLKNARVTGVRGRHGGEVHNGRRSLQGLGESLPIVEKALTQVEPREVLLRRPNGKILGIHANQEGDKG